MTASRPGPTPRQLILRLLLARDGEALEVANAVRAGGLFDISANSTRVALTRLLSAGLIETGGRGAYRLGKAGRALGGDVAVWREVERRLGAWQGHWVAALALPLPRSEAVAELRRERAFALVGMRALAAGLYVRPDNLVGGTAQLRQRLHALGLDRDVPVFQLAELDEAHARKAHRLWQVRALETAYRSGQRRLQASLLRLPALSIEAAARESYLVGDEALRKLVFDPLLPAPLVDEVSRRDYFDAVRQYDAAGQQIWQRFLAGA